MGRLRRLTALGILLVVAVPALLLLWRWYAPGPSAGPTTVLVPEGATVTSTANNLQRLGVISSARWFRAGAKLFGSRDPVQAGEFEIRKGMSAASILELLQHGRPVQRLITVTEGMPSIVVEEKIASNRYLTGPMPAIAEGSLLPDSYSYERAEARTAVVQRMQTAMARAVDALWPKRDYVCPIVTKEQAVTLASIVEKETGKASERPMIAGVYCNRLKIGMKLDADPTVIYPVTKGKPLGRRILRSELNSDSPYNTYRHAGLPPGPIANPGKASIEAVLHPAKTKAIYFVADGTGGLGFADTFAQHQANVARWYQIRRERGQM